MTNMSVQYGQSETFVANGDCQACCSALLGNSTHGHEKILSRPFPLGIAWNGVRHFGGVIRKCWVRMSILPTSGSGDTAGLVEIWNGPASWSLPSAQRGSLPCFPTGGQSPAGGSRTSCWHDGRDPLLLVTMPFALFCPSAPPQFPFSKRSPMTSLSTRKDCWQMDLCTWDLGISKSMIWPGDTSTTTTSPLCPTCLMIHVQYFPNYSFHNLNVTGPLINTCKV